MPMVPGAIGFGEADPRRLAREVFVGLALAEEMSVELGLSLAERGVRSSFVEVLLAVTATRTLHHMDCFEIEVPEVGIGWILGQSDSLKKVYVAKGLVPFAAPQTAETV